VPTTGLLDVFLSQHVALHDLESFASVRRKLGGVSYEDGDFFAPIERLIDEVPPYFARSPENRDLHVNLNDLYLRE
jgi:hypothetical protein